MTTNRSEVITAVGRDDNPVTRHRSHTSTALSVKTALRVSADVLIGCRMPARCTRRHDARVAAAGESDRLRPVQARDGLTATDDRPCRRCREHMLFDGRRSQFLGVRVIAVPMPRAGEVSRSPVRRAALHRSRRVNPTTEGRRHRTLCMTRLSSAGIVMAAKCDGPLRARFARTDVCQTDKR